MSREILLLVDALAHEKSVAREIIFEAVEEALASATKKKHKDAIDIKVEIDQESGEYKTFRKWTILPEDLLEDEEIQISLEDDRAKGHVENDIIKEPIESVEFVFYDTLQTSVPSAGSGHQFVIFVQKLLLRVHQTSRNLAN